MKYFAAVAVPQSYRADIEIVHCAWRGIGLYSSPRAAEKAAQKYIAALEQDLPPELAGEASYLVTDTAKRKPRPPFVQKLIDRFQAQSAKGAKS